MYTNNDIDKFLVEARKEKEKVLSQIHLVATGRDANAISYAISNSDFYAEDFYRFDSDVCERFLILMELVGIAK